MSTTMMVTAVIALWLVWTAGFVFGAMYASRGTEAKIHNMKIKCDSIISILQHKLVTDNDHRGFQTRTHVVAWLDRMRPEVKEELLPGVHNGSETI